VLVWDVRTWTHTTFASAGEFAQPELGWAFAREHWGCGYATEAALAVRQWTRAERGLGRLISLIAPANARSQQLARRLGCTPYETVELFDNGAHVLWEHPR
jgi:RimJ/RimL family protein N-acetyltransferase